ncbi:DUF3472 domain-containing protein [Paludibacter sp. 221]|uniref:DUF3472 domain-containing protein n=1 Tax=Paludibacter sp. 221 TaxID=2302939 RepID=UPI0013D251CF|nr:DUF3472 domain-containing protein [Paludibacter sp. 221]NDV46607.1 DUF3472 domain-containing protein [Paludibacter sp. 221]
MKNTITALILGLFFQFAAIAQNETPIGLGGNAYITNSVKDKHIRITDTGIKNWTDKDEIISVYFHLSEPQVLDISLVASGKSAINVSCMGKTHKVKLHNDSLSKVKVGKFQVKESGYVRVDIQGAKKSGDAFGNITELVLNNAKGKITYVHDFSNYWGRRGPSVHMKYTLPQDTVEWFYNEVTVPKEGETMWSYYMANGFGEGYFGMQYNSDKERRVLFSVWSPFQTDDPKSIPEEERIIMLRRGEDVHIGEFGNEGSGGQSFLRYNWTAGTTYKFLAQVKPDGKGNTVYTAYFYATDENRWRLIASFSRPKTNTWYRGAHSFLENFSPTGGYKTRFVEFGNQWARTKNGNWIELTEGTFTYDATAGAGVRLDYQGGIKENNRFYLKNCGFFNQNTEYRSVFQRKPEGNQPEIDFEMLENL